jgi:hypothetical protein
LRSAGFIDEDHFEADTMARRELLFKQLSSLPTKPPISVSSSVIKILGTIRIVGSISFYDEHAEQVREVSDVMIRTIDEATPELTSRLYHGSGTLSTEGRLDAIDEWNTFARHLKYHNLKLQSITFGRGMMDFVEDGDFVSLLKEIGFSNVMILPSTDYSFESATSAALNSVFGA